MRMGKGSLIGGKPIASTDDLIPLNENLESHKKDGTLHISSAERTAWNAKETPAGAQDKVNAHANDSIKHITAAERTTWNGKANASHTHAVADVVNLQATLNGKADVSHSHSIAQVTDLQTSLDAKETPSGAQAKVNSHANDSVKHITAAERAAWNGKANGSHTHAIGDITNLQSELNGKAASSHTHTIANITNLQTTLDAKETPAGAQGKVDTHSNDSVKHITAAERTAWNGKANGSHTHTVANVTGLQAELDAKETPGGAQSKADKALADAKSYTDNSNSVSIEDTRSLDRAPIYYMTKKIQYEFKQLSTLGLSSSTGTYCTLMTDGRWSGSSGGQVTQIAFTDDSLPMTRTSISTTAWGPWHTMESAAGAQEKVNTHANDSVKHITTAERSSWNAKETPGGAQAKANKALADAKEYTDTKVFTTNSHQYPLTATSNNQVSFTIPLAGFSPQNDTILVAQNGMFLSSDEYTINLDSGTSRYYIVLDSGVKSGTQIFIMVLKNIAPGA